MQKNIIIDSSKRVYYNYFVKEKYECGVVLFSWEVKAIRYSSCSIINSYVILEKSECWLVNMLINPPYFLRMHDFSYKQRNIKLLLKRNELNFLSGLLKLKRYTIVPSKVYWKNNFIKVEACLCVGKKLYDKRSLIKEREWKDRHKLYQNR